MEIEELQKFISHLNTALDKMLIGRPKKAYMDEDEFSDVQLKEVSQKFNRVIHDLNEACTFASEIAEGNLSADVPPRQNVVAGPLKHLHSNLMTLVWNMKELLAGRITSKLDESGDLFDVFNQMIDKVAEDSTNPSFAFTNDESSTINSWRYHQILSAINMLNIIIIELDEQGNIVYKNSPADSLLKGITRIYHDIKHDNTDAVLQILTDLTNPDKNFPILKELHDEKTNTWYKITSNIFSLPNGKRFYLHMIDDITYWKLSQQELEITATTDALSGALNRRPGIERLNALLSTPSDNTHCLIFLDVDSLKTINDTFGHNEGDYAIKTIAQTILSSVRAVDSVVRYGGDEFFILFGNCPEYMPETTISRINKKLESINAQNDKPYNLNISYGIVTFGYNPERKPKDLLEAADRDMYKNKMRKKERGFAVFKNRN